MYVLDYVRDKKGTKVLTPMQDKQISIDCACVVSMFEVRIILMVLPDRISRKRLKARENFRSNFVCRETPYRFSWILSTEKKTVVGSNDSNGPRYWLPILKLNTFARSFKGSKLVIVNLFFRKIDLLPLFRSMGYLCPCKIYEMEMCEPRSKTQRWRDYHSY